MTRLSAAVSATLVMCGVALTAALPARADEGTIEMQLFKVAFLVGGTGGKGTMVLDGQSYPLSIGGISAGLTIAFSETTLTGTVKNITSPAQIEGVFSAAGAGIAVAAGGQAAIMTNANGVTIAVTGTEMGVDASIDLTGLTITLAR